MEQLFRSQKVPEIKGVKLFPLRHHSPACSFHLKRMIDEYGPDLILIEGPENAGEMIPVLTAEGTEAPVALYYFYRDKKGLVSPENEDYRCYYPFLDYSPELVALREAKRRGIEARFVDLSYGDILLGTAEHRGIRRDDEKQTYNDDYYLSRSRYLNALCEKTGLRDFNELWEKYFEIDGLHCATEEFVERMRLWCVQTREQTPREDMEADGCFLRERHMAKRIQEAQKDHQRILVVTGGFHTPGLEELLAGEGEREFEPIPSVGSAGEQGVYPLAYSMEATDALNGYASGMVSPGFYQRVWENLERGEAPEEAYRAAVLHQLVSAGRRARQKKESISSADIISALDMAQGLAALRGKRGPGLYELRDGALASFVKGECNLSTDLPLRILQEINTGYQVGTLCGEAPRPPILSDFEDQCKKFHFKIQATGHNEVTLEIFVKERHREASRFLYRMDFLDTKFASRKKGADLVNRRDRSRIREVWTYQFSSHVLAALVDVSMAGATVEEAARSRMISRFSASESVRDTAKLLTQGFLMGFLEEQTEMLRSLDRIIAEDGDFFSLTEGFSHLKMLYELQDLYQVRAGEELERLLALCFQKIVQLLPSMAQVGDDQLQPCMEACLSLYQLTGRAKFSEHRSVLMEALGRLSRDFKIYPGLLGAVLGLLYGHDHRWENEIERTAGGYLQGTEEMRRKSAVFLRGLFFTARDVIFVNESFLTMIDQLVASLDSDEFLQLLPELRMAFGYFTPLETDRIAGRAAELHGVSKKTLRGGRMVSPKLFDYGQRLDRFAKEGDV